MQDKTFTNFTEQTRGFFEPMRKLNGLMLDNMEKMTQFQLESMKRYSQMGTEQLRDASDIQDAEGMRDFGARQAEILNELSKQMMEDAQAMTELSMQFKGEMERVFAEIGEKVTEQTQAATQEATQAMAKAGEQAQAAAQEATQAATKAGEQAQTATKSSGSAKASSQSSRKNS